MIVHAFLDFFIHIARSSWYVSDAIAMLCEIVCAVSSEAIADSAGGVGFCFMLSTISSRSCLSRIHRNCYDQFL